MKAKRFKDVRLQRKLGRKIPTHSCVKAPSDFSSRTVFFYSCTIPLAVIIITGYTLYRTARKSLELRYAIALDSFSLLLWLVQLLVLFVGCSSMEPVQLVNTSWEWNSTGAWADMSVQGTKHPRLDFHES